LARTAVAAETDGACANARAQAEARSSQAGIPYLTMSSQVQPESDDRRAESLRLGLELNLSDFAKRERARERANADCVRFEAEYTAETLGLAGRVAVELSGLEARKKALDVVLEQASANLAERQRRLAAFHDTRAGVGRSAQEVAALKQDLIETASRIEMAKRQSAIYPKSKREPADVLADLTRATTESLRATAAEARGPAWDLTVGAGWAKSRYADSGGTFEYSTGQPMYGSVGLRWRPAVAFARDVVSEQMVGTAKLETMVESWDADRKTMAEAYTAKLALVEERLAQVRADLALLTETRTSELRDYEQLLKREERTLVVDEADWSARLVTLAVPVTPIKAGVPADKPRSFAKFDKMTVTEGTAESVGLGVFATKGAKVRARGEGGRGASEVRATFKYLGQTETVEPLASGEDRRQLGLFLAAKNQCNLLYVMWRLPLKGEGPGELVVQRKINPGQETHAQCGNRGYETVKPTRVDALPNLSINDSRVLDVALVASRLTVGVDDRIVWEGEINLAGLDAASGEVGWRSDNVLTEFSLARVSEVP